MFEFRAFRRGFNLFGALVRALRSSARQSRRILRLDEAERRPLRVVTCRDPHAVRKLDGPDDDSAVPAHTVDCDVEGRDGEEEEPVVCG